MSAKKTALVTGGAQGIGLEIAQRLHREGMNVVVADIDTEAIVELNDASDSSILGIAVDVASEVRVQQLFRTIQENFGGLDALVNNAAIVNPVNEPVAELSLAHWNRVIAVNLTGAFICARYAAPFLTDTGGAIVNIASTRAIQSEPNTEAYSASKGGLIALTHALAMSLGPAVRVNCVSPGWIATQHKQKNDNRREQIFTDADHWQHPVGRVGLPEDIASMVAFLVSPQAGFITGQNFVIDGGMTRKMIYVE
jgi:NAD(P)-dependent dehydrogenase (short-subunit alcohol dehydrogenase family)